MTFRTIHEHAQILQIRANKTTSTPLNKAHVVTLYFTRKYVYVCHFIFLAFCSIILLKHFVLAVNKKILLVYTFMAVS